MKLDLADVPELPLGAAMLSPDGAVLASTPEWPGRLAGTIIYSAGRLGQLLIAPDGHCPPHLEAAVDRVLQELQDGLGVMDVDSAMRARVLIASLELVAGRPLRMTSDRVSVDEILALARGAIAGRKPDLKVDVMPSTMSAPEAWAAPVALAMEQLAVNAHVHDDVQRIRLEASEGPAFWVEWSAPKPSAKAIRTSRHSTYRERWGLGFVRLVADALGGTMLPPGPRGEDREGACIAFGAERLTLPLALYEGSRLTRRTTSWDQEIKGASSAPTPLTRSVPAALAAARRQPGAIAYHDVLSARAVEHRTWVAMPPQTGMRRIADVLKGLEHEKALVNAPEPARTRIWAATVVLAIGLTGQLKTVDRERWSAGFPSAMGALGAAIPNIEGTPLMWPDPRLAAYLLVAGGGQLEVVDGAITWRPPKDALQLAQLIARAGGRSTPSGGVPLTPSLDSVQA